MWKDTVINLKVCLLRQMLLAELKHLTQSAVLYTYQEYTALTSEKKTTLRKVVLVFTGRAGGKGMLVEHTTDFLRFFRLPDFLSLLTLN